MALPLTATLYHWARSRRPPRTRSYFGELARLWQPMAKRHLHDGKRPPKNYLGLHWQGGAAKAQRERAAYQILKKR